MALLSGLIAHWRCNEASGTRYDAHAAHHLSEYLGSVSGVTGKLGDAAYFAPLADPRLIRNPVDSDLDLGASDFTVSFWARASGEHYGELLGWVNPFFIVYTELTGELAVQCGASYYTFGSFPLSAWHFVILSYDAANSRLYGWLDNSGPIIRALSPTPLSGAQEFYLGGYYTNYGGRRVDSVSVWQRFITETERTQLWNGGYGYDYPFDNQVELTGSLAGQSTVTGQLDVQVTMTSSVQGLSWLATDVRCQKLAVASPDGRSSVVAALAITKLLNSGSAGASAPAGSLTLTKPVVATSSGRSSVVAPLTATKLLTSASAGGSTAAAFVVLTTHLAADSAGRSSVVGSPVIHKVLDAVSEAASSVSSDLTTTETEILDGQSTCSSNVTADLSGALSLSAAVTGESSITAGLDLSVLMDADAGESASAVSAEVVCDKLLAGSQAGQSSISAELGTDHELATAEVVCGSDVTAALAGDVLLTASVDVASALTVTLRCDHICTAQSEAGSTVTASLTVGVTIQEADAESIGTSTLTASLEVGRILVSTASGSSTVVADLGGLTELSASITAEAVVTAALPPVSGPPYWYQASGLGFTLAVEVHPRGTSAATAPDGGPSLASAQPEELGAAEAYPGEAAGKITSRAMIKLARAVNDRLRSGLGDGPWRIVYYLLGLFREMRNPSEDGWRRPAWAEFFESYQPVTPEEGEWPLTGPGEPEGANVNSPLGAYLFGNLGAGISSEAEMLNGIPMTLQDGRQAATMGESWQVKKRQMGAMDPATGATYAPALSAARAWGAIRYSRRSQHLTSYGGWLASPDLLETGCDDPDELDGAPPPPNYEIKFAATEAGEAAGYTDKTYAGTCAVGPSISPEDKYDEHVAGVVDTPWEYYVVLNSGTVEVLPRWAYVEGPYMGQPKLRKTTGDQLARALARGAAEWRGDRQNAGAASALDSGAVDRPNDWLVGAFNAQEFFTRQYSLAPVLGRATTDAVAGEYPSWRMDAPAEALALSAGTVITPLGVADAHIVADGAAVRHLYLSATAIAGECTIGVQVDGVQVVACTLTTEFPEDILALPEDAEAGSSIALVLLTSARFSAGGRIEGEMAQQVAYKPDMSDLICVLRRAAPEIAGPDYSLGSAVSSQLSRYGLLAPPFSGQTEAQTPTQYTSYPVYEAARRWSKVVRIIPRRQLVGYAVEDGKSVLWFRRQALGIGGQTYRVEIAQGTGGIVPGQEYVVEGAPGDQVQYGSLLIDPGGHFVGTPDDDDFIVNGTPRVFAISSGIMDQAIGGDLFGGIAEQVRHTAPPGGFTNEWLLGVQLKPYHTSQSSIWKPEVFADRYPLQDRAAFYSPEIANELDRSKLWHAAYGMRIPSLFGGNMLAEWPTGYRYAPLTSAWSGRQFLNQIIVDGSRWPTEEDRQKFYRSCRIYEPDVDVESCEAITEGQTELVKVTLTGRLHSTYGETGGAPSSVPRDMSQWSASLIENEPYRTTENAIRAYLLHSTTGRNFGAVIGDNAANSYVQDLTDNPFASIFPHFYLVKLVPEPFEDGNEDQDPDHDTPLWHDPLAQVDLYLRAICEGYVDQVQSTDQLLAWVAANSGALPESWGLHDYTYPELCRQAFGGAWAGIMPSAGGAVAAGDLRPDFPHGFGPWPKTYATAEVFNRLVKSVNLLTKVRLMVPYIYQVKQDGFFGSRVHQPQIEVTMTGNVAEWVDRCDVPLADTPDPSLSVDWAENSIALSMSSGGLGAVTVEALDLVTEAHSKVRASWRVSLSDGIADAFPPFVSALFDGSNVSAIGWFERTRTNHTRTSVDYAESEPCDGNLGWYTEGGEYFAWPVGPINESDSWADIAAVGSIVADPPPSSDCGLGRTSSMPTETFESEGGAISSLQVTFLFGATLFLDVPLLP